MTDSECTFPQCECSPICKTLHQKWADLFYGSFCNITESQRVCQPLIEDHLEPVQEKEQTAKQVDGRHR